jgi:hypothetical protein
LIASIVTGAWVSMVLNFVMSCDSATSDHISPKINGKAIGLEIPDMRLLRFSLNPGRSGIIGKLEALAT